MNRLYDKTLVSDIQRKQRTTVDSAGLVTMLKPIPDDDRQNVLDPRVLQIAAKKKEVHKHISFAPKYSLRAQRYRPDKINYDLTETEVVEDEVLIPINNDHLIDAFFCSQPSTRKDRPAMIFLHGGGFTAGDYGLYRNSMRFLAEKSGGVIIFPEYRLAPENPFPCGLDDCWGTITWVYENAETLGIDANKIMVAGDSAGGNLSLACEIRDENRIVKELFLLYPSVDSTPLDKLAGYSWSYDQYPVIEEHKELAVNRIERIKSGGGTLGNIYLQGRTDYKDPFISPVYYNNLDKFPRTIIAAAEYDFLRLGSDHFARLLKQQNVDVQNVQYLGCDHGFLDGLGIVPQAEEICLFMADELQNLGK
ncbi:MAG: alpha/beta hydrolase [Anaerolineaceae bacterium]|nr:alpha/beta hydrolase [Anaerolineaceae bacterium]